MRTNPRYKIQLDKYNFVCNDIKMVLKLGHFNWQR